jgi:DNA (cytosine-5)-methyltransferase 1
MRFIDLFAGLGGFHLALRRLGHDCIFACEIDPVLRGLYEQNLGLRPAGDIRSLDPASVPSHDILCAGFPCQPFSKAGEQQGTAHPRWGDLFNYVLAVVQAREPRYVILENVPNLAYHRGRATWQDMESALRAAGYDMRTRVLSPHSFGIPQVRARLFVVASAGAGSLSGFTWPEPAADQAAPALASVLDHSPEDARPISAQVVRCLEAWQEFLDTFPRDARLPSTPVWSMEFGATYPYEETTPWTTAPDELRRLRGSHGRTLDALADDDLLAVLPSHARTAEPRFPAWKVQHIRANRQLYATHSTWIDHWLPRILEFPPSLQKLEWNAQGGERDIWRYVIQLRASGVRVKRPTTAPSLVAMTTTQVPIIAWERRFMTVRECARLQGMDELSLLPVALSRAYEALGNAVNVDLVAMIAAALVGDTAAPAQVTAASAGSGATSASTVPGVSSRTR